MKPQTVFETTVAAEILALIVAVFLQPNLGAVVPIISLAPAIALIALSAIKTTDDARNILITDGVFLALVLLAAAAGMPGWGIWVLRVVGVMITMMALGGAVEKKKPNQ